MKFERKQLDITSSICALSQDAFLGSLQLLAVLLCYRLERLFVVFTAPQLSGFAFERGPRGISGTTSKALSLDWTALFGNSFTPVFV